MKKRFARICVCILLLVFIAASGAGMSACQENRVVSIEIVQDSFKDAYMLDETLDLTDAYIYVRYKNGESGTVAITRSMVTGFDTGTPATRRTLTVTYKKATALFGYSVGADGAVDTPFRLTLAKNGAGTEIRVSAANVQRIADGVTALSFKITVNGGTVSTLTSAMSAEFEMVQAAVSDGIRVVFYAKNGQTTLDTDGLVARITVTKTESAASLTLSEIRIADSEPQDYTGIPPVSLTL